MDDGTRYIDFGPAGTLITSTGHPRLTSGVTRRGRRLDLGCEEMTRRLLYHITAVHHAHPCAEDAP
jgi:hypothetical protein